MVVDKIEHASLYYGLGKRFQTALEWLASADVGALTPGQRVDIDGDNVFATLFEVDTLPPALRHGGCGLCPARRGASRAE